MKDFYAAFPYLLSAALAVLAFAAAVRWPLGTCAFSLLLFAVSKFFDKN